VKLLSFGGAFFILRGERGGMAKEVIKRTEQKVLLSPPTEEGPESFAQR
jgi:hypothetical protein